MVEEFVKALQKDPDLLNKLRARASKEAFYEKYDIERASPFKCPTCAKFLQSPGTLYIHKNDKSLFTCRKCKLTFHIECQTISNEELMWKMRQVGKEDSEDVHWFDKRLTKE